MKIYSQSGWARIAARFDGVLLAAPGDEADMSAPVSGADALAEGLWLLSKPGPAFFSADQMLAAQADQRLAQRRWLQHQMLVLDGTCHMQQLGGRWRQRLHRLAIKLREASVGPRAGTTPQGPWDCGWLHTSPAALLQAAHFLPRRPTLMVAWDLEPAMLAAMRTALQQGQARYSHPVRLWALSEPLPR